MKKLFLTIIVVVISVSAHSQNVASKIGGSLSANYFETDYGRLPGFGIMLEHRLEFRDSKFELKNNLGVEVVNNLKDKYARHFLYKFGAIGEYNFFRFGAINRYGKNWTPYIGFGGNVIYYDTAVYDESPYEENSPYVTGVTFALKNTFGAKIKINRKLIFHTELAFDYNFSGKIDGNIAGSNKLNHTSMVSIGLEYQIN